MDNHKGHILFINRVFPPDSGASGLRLMELCQGLAEKGWKISVLTNKGRNVAPDGLHANIKLIRLPFGSNERKPKPAQYAGWLFALFFRAVFLPRADITVTMTDPPMSVIISAFLRLVKKTKTVHWVHDLYPELFPVMGIRLGVLQPILMGLSHWSMRRHKKIVVIGDCMKAIVARFIKDENKIAMIPNWPDAQAAFLDKKKPARHDSQNPFILEGVFTVLYSGNFGLVHEFGPIIDAIKIVHQSPHPIRFIFAGDGRKFTEVRDRVEQMMLSNVHFIRAQPKDKFIDMLLAGDVHIATVIPEAAGLVAPSKINSALGLARPCIYLGSTKCAQAKMIRDFDAGVVVDPGDNHAKFLIAEAVIRYATNHHAYEEAQENALKAAESISYAKGIAAFNELFSGLVS
jgi:glycosyltransferase involved in cell wall biosynthesis